MLSGMDLAELQVFLTVASERSFSRAAARLHRTQPAISQAVKRLEDDLGERLFDRSAKDEEAYVAKAKTKDNLGSLGRLIMAATRPWSSSRVVLGSTRVRLRWESHE